MKRIHLVVVMVNYLNMRIHVRCMPNVTFAVPEELYREMRSHSEVKWAEVARRALQKEVTRLHVYDRLFAKSKLTEKDAIELGREVRRSLARRSE